MYAGKDKSAHTPTKDELKRQAEYEERRRKWPTLYRGDAKAWAAWDYHAADRLALEIMDPSYERYPDHVVGRWYDRRGKRLEQYFSDVMVAMPTAVALLRHHRAVEEEKRRRRAEADEQARRAAARQARQVKRAAFLDELAGQQARMDRLKALARLLGGLAADDEFKLAQQLARSLDQTIAELAQRFEPDALEAEIRRRALFTDEDD